MKNFWSIVLGTTLLACLLGICLDMVTAHVAVEYFSVHHPVIVDTNQPWLLALIWGVAASWWFGAAAGLIIAVVNQKRSTPLDYHRILKWIGVACILLWALMIAVLLGVYLFANNVPLEARRETFEHDRRLIAVAMAHQCEYVLGVIALIVIGVKVGRTEVDKEQI